MSNNRIVEMRHLNELKGLQTLILSHNRIAETMSLSLPILTSLNLDRNKIKQVTGLRGLKKLQELSLEGNQIENASMQDIGFKLINLLDLNLSNNCITVVSKLIGYPKVQSITLDKNPITAIEQSAFRDCPDLEKISINEIKLPNYTGDLKFLNHCANLLVSDFHTCKL